MARQIREEPKASRPVSLYIGPSFEAAWEHVLLPWFETVAARAFENRLPVAVITPFRSHAQLFRSKLLAAGISLLGVKFLSPAQLRELLLRGSGLNIPLREHLRLLLAIAAEELANNNPESLVARSVARDPDHFLRVIDQLHAAGWELQEIEPLVLREIAARFERRVRDCGFTLVHEADRAAVANTEKSEPRFSHLLVCGFDGAHWPLWPLLRAAVSFSETATVVLSDPRDEARDLDETWVGTWEENFGASQVIDAIAERSTSSPGQIHFLVGRDTTDQAEAIVALTAKFLGQENCERIGILFPRTGALPRLVATFLGAVKIAHNDGIAHLTPSAFDDNAWRIWLDLQENSRLKNLLHFLRALPAQIFEEKSIFEVEKTLRGAYADVLIDNIDILREHLGRKNGNAEIIRSLEKIEFLPGTATLPRFL